MDYLAERSIVCKNIRRLRYKNKLSLEQLAEKTGIPAGTIGSYEHERCKPSPERIKIFADVYGVPEAYLYDVHLPSESLSSVRLRRLGLAVTVWNGTDWEIRAVTLMNDDLKDRLKGHELGDYIQKAKKEVYIEDRLSSNRKVND